MLESSNQRYFKELTDQDVRARMYEEQKNAIEQDMAPFGFLDDGLEEEYIQDDQVKCKLPVQFVKFIII